jgi:CO/xanthine dehydrogenase Mo-binding subunit
MTALGASPNRLDGHPKTTGEATYACDIQADGMLHAKVVFTDQPHARLLSLDTEACRRAPGVVAVVTGADVPTNTYGLTMNDQPVLITPDPGDGTAAWTRDPTLVPADVSRWEADHLAVVVAETEEQATAAARLLAPVWEPLPVVADLAHAVAPDAPNVHPELPSAPGAADPIRWSSGTDDGFAGRSPGPNAYHRLVIRKGDAATALAAADVVVEGTYQVPYQEHAYLQTEAAVAYVDDEDRITVETGGQWTHEDQEQVAHALGLEPDRVRIVYRAIGGAFGGKEDMSLQIVMALAAR